MYESPLTPSLFSLTVSDLTSFESDAWLNSDFPFVNHVG